MDQEAEKSKKAAAGLFFILSKLSLIFDVILYAYYASEIWTSWEGLNCILLGQVSEIESLISMPQDFRFVVFNLWAKYLQVTEIAFSKHRLMPHWKKALKNRYIL